MHTAVSGSARIGLAAAALIATATLGAMADDVKGSKDNPLVGRYEGAEITQYAEKAYDEIALPSAAVTRENKSDTAAWQTDLAGKVTSIRYEGPEGRSALEVMRNYEKALTDGGFEIAFSCRGKTCSEVAIPTFWTAGKGAINLPSAWDTTAYLLARKQDGGKIDHVGILAVETGGKNNRPTVPHVAVTVVEGEAMETDKIGVVEASEMEQAIARDGKIAVYGIYFDFDKADLKPESDLQIDQLATLMKDNPTLEILVVGHTDGKGEMGYNLTLSQARAQAVADRLSSSYGIDKSRMTAAGAGMMSPVATNRTEEGRAKNRRVEIVEIYRGG